VDGKLAVNPLPQPLLPLRVLIGGIEAPICYAGAAPGEIAGMLQVNALIPGNIGSGPQSITFQIGDAGSQAGVFVTVE
jgi:uncharacterized protein (TIGR03437 family)